MSRVLLILAGIFCMTYSVEAQFRLVKQGCVGLGLHCEVSSTPGNPELYWKPCCKGYTCEGFTQVHSNNWRNFKGICIPSLSDGGAA